MLKKILVGILDITTLTCESELKGAYYFIPAERKQKIKKLKKHSDKMRSFGAELLLNECLLAYKYGNFNKLTILNSSMEDIIKNIQHTDAFQYQVTYNHLGKPVLAGENNIYMNLSHAGDYAVCAIASEPVGIDIEGKRKVNNAVMRKCFSEDEINWVNENINGREERFFRLWTAKEAFSKTTGRGLAQIMEGIYFTEKEKLQFADAELNKQYTIYEFDELRKKGYCLTLVIKEGN